MIRAKWIVGKHKATRAELVRGTPFYAHVRFNFPEDRFKIIFGWATIRPESCRQCARGVVWERLPQMGTAGVPEVNRLSEGLLRGIRKFHGIGDLRCDSNLQIAYGSIPVVFRFGTNPTGIRVTSFRDLISTTDTSFVTALAT